MYKTMPAPIHVMQTAIQLAGFHYITCLKTTPTNQNGSAVIGQNAYVFSAIQGVDDKWLHVEFQRWAAANVLRDLIESFSIFLTEVYREAAGKNLRANSITVDKFERKGLEDQLSLLAGDFGVDPAWTTRLAGYNRARNCLAHRQGIVGPRDTTDGDELVVRWFAFRGESASGHPQQTIDIAGPLNNLIRGVHIEGGATRLELHDKEKRIRVGSAVEFDPSDVLEICQVFHLAAAAFYGLSAP